MSYATFGSPELNEKYKRRLNWKDIRSFIRKTRRSNNEVALTEDKKEGGFKKVSFDLSFERTSSMTIFNLDYVRASYSFSCSWYDHKF